MYSLEERLLAVKTYYEMGKNAKATVRRLGYPDESNISRWVKEYERDQALHEHRVRYSKYTDAEKQTAIEYYYAHGQNGLQTVKDLGYPSRTLLSQWVKENPRGTGKDCKKWKGYVRCSEEQREQAVLESCKGTTLKAIAETYGVSEAAVIQWRKKYLGKVRKKRMPDPSPQETLDIVQLQKEKQALEAGVKALRKEHYLLQLENDALKEAARQLKKARGINLKEISNREKAMVIDALRDRYVYSCRHSESDDLQFKRLCAGVRKKLEAMTRHDMYSLYKSGANEEIRGKARQDYLNAVGLLDSFQWSPEQDVNVTHKEIDIR